ncbi:MAG: dephospho-CoA kinase [Elusimicrobia bacterium]|nr:dephospho-CoA kinase [Elusimicrobiota bacterium]
MKPAKNSRRLFLALTGGFGSGKSEALDCFKRLGAVVFNCDRIGKELTCGADRYIVKKIIKVTGCAALNKDGRLDRTKIAEVVFKDSNRRKKLEKLLHPLIMKELLRRAAGCGGDIVAAEVPLLFETHLESLFDASVAMRVAYRTAVKRLHCAGWSLNQIEKRVKSQMPLKMKCCKADFILDNNGSRRELFRQARMIHNACRAVLSYSN